MSNTVKNEKVELTVDIDNLFREETFSDLKFASIKRLSPVKPDGSQDYTRKAIFIGITQITSPHGAIPIQSFIEAKNLKQAWENFPAVMNRAVEKFIEEAKKMQEQEGSRIIVPGSSSSGGLIEVPE